MTHRPHIGIDRRKLRAMTRRTALSNGVNWSKHQEISKAQIGRLKEYDVPYLRRSAHFWRNLLA